MMTMISSGTSTARLRRQRVQPGLVATKILRESHFHPSLHPHHHLLSFLPSSCQKVSQRQGDPKPLVRPLVTKVDVAVDARPVAQNQFVMRAKPPRMRRRKRVITQLPILIICFNNERLGEDAAFPAAWTAFNVPGERQHPQMNRKMAAAALKDAPRVATHGLMQPSNHRTHHAEANVAARHAPEISVTGATRASQARHSQEYSMLKPFKPPQRLRRTHDEQTAHFETDRTLQRPS